MKCKQLVIKIECCTLFIVVEARAQICIDGFSTAVKTGPKEASFSVDGISEESCDDMMSFCRSKKL